MILRGVSIFYTKFLISQRKQNQNILTHWSVAQEGSNFEKKLQVKNLVGLSSVQGQFAYEHFVWDTINIFSCSYHKQGRSDGEEMREYRQ